MIKHGHGRWVFQNGRWLYIPQDEKIVPSQRPWQAPVALSSLVDLGYLLRPLRRWRQVTGGDFLVVVKTGDGVIKPVRDEGVENADEDLLKVAREHMESSGRQEDEGGLSVMSVQIRTPEGAQQRGCVACSNANAEQLEWLGEIVSSYNDRLSEVANLRMELFRIRDARQALLARFQGMEKRLMKDVSTSSVFSNKEIGLSDEAVLAHLLDLPEIGVSVEDEDYRIIYMNRSMRVRYGDRVGERCYKVFKDRDEPCADAECPLHLLFEPDAPNSSSHVTRDLDRGLWFEVVSVPVVGKDGKRRIIEVGVDVTRYISSSTGTDSK